MSSKSLTTTCFNGWPTNPEGQRESILMSLSTGTSPEVWMEQGPDRIWMHPEQLDALIDHATELRTRWRQSQSPLYREPSTAGEA